MKLVRQEVLDFDSQHVLLSDDVAALCCLASAVHGEAMIRYIMKGNASLLSQELRLLDLALTFPKITVSQRCWCLKQKTVVQILIEDTAGASQTVQQVRY